MKKKLIALLCMAAMSVSMLAGCGEKEEGGGSSEQTGQSSDSGSKAEESAEGQDGSAEGQDGAGEGYGLEYAELDWYLDLGERPDMGMVNDALNEYLIEKINTKVNMHIMGAEDYSAKVPTKLSAGENLGLVTIGSGVNYTVQAKQGAFYPMDELLETYGVGIRGLFSDDVWDTMRIDGKIYAIPILKDNCYIMNMIYNEEMAQALELDMENLEYKNWRQNEEFFTNALALRDEKFPEHKGKPLLNDITMEVPFYFGLETFLDNYVAVCNIDGINDVAGYDSNTVFNLYATDEYREFCRMKQRMVAGGVYAYDFSNFPDSMYDGSLLATSGWGFTYINEHLYGDKFTTRLKVAENVWTDTNNYIGGGTAISVNCENPERAMMVMELVNTDPYVATLLRFGIEGEHYLIDGDGNMTFDGSPRNSDPANRGYQYWYGASFGNLTIVDAPESFTGPDNIMLQRIVEYNNSALLPAHMGFVLDTSSISNEIAACSNVVAEYSDTLRKGQYDTPEAVDAAIDQFNEKLKANNVDKILEEVQAQIDAWNAANK